MFRSSAPSTPAAFCGRRDISGRASYGVVLGRAGWAEGEDVGAEAAYAEGRAPPGAGISARTRVPAPGRLVTSTRPPR